MATTETRNQIGRRDNRAALWTVLLLVALAILAYIAYAAYYNGADEYGMQTNPNTAGTTTTGTINNTP